MKHGDVFKSDGRIELRQSIAESFFRNDVISRHMGVAGINAGADRNVIAQMFDDFCDLLKAAAQRVFSSGGVFDEDRKSAFHEIEFVAGRGNGGCGLE